MNDEKNEVEIYTLEDEEGAEHEFELIGTCEKDGVKYFALIPAEESEKDDEFCEYVILKAVPEEDGSESLVSIDDDEEFDDIADYFDDLFSEDIDYDAKPEEKK